MPTTNPYLFIHKPTTLKREKNSLKPLCAKFIVYDDNSIHETENESFFRHLHFPILEENGRYVVTEWLADKLCKFRSDSLLAATLTRDLLFDDKPITFAIHLLKTKNTDEHAEIIVELETLQQETLWQFQQNKDSALFYQVFKNNALPMLIIDKDFHVLAANDNYKNLICFTKENTLQEINILKNLSQASREKLLSNHAKRLLNPYSAPNRYHIDIVDTNGVKHSCFILSEFINANMDCVISLLDSAEITSLTLDESNHTHLHIPFYQSPSITFITTMEGKILDANQSFYVLSGLRKNNLQGMFWFDLTTNCSNIDHQDMIHKLKTDNAIENLQFTFIFSVLSPKQRNTLLSARLIQFNDAPAVIFTLIDISTTLHLPSDVFHMEELKVASELAASVGHEVRNPMTAVRGFLQMLGKKPDLVKYDSYFSLMLEELDRANQIITEYLSLAKTKTNKLTMENINDIIGQLFPLLQISALNANKKIVLNLSATNDLYLDGKEIRQLILNLVKNGLESMENGKNLTIKTYQTTINSTMLEIKDEGSGIPSNVLDKIGSPFFTTKATGTGLGLPICYSIAEKNNAKISFTTAPTGTTFSIEFTKL